MTTTPRPVYRAPSAPSDTVHWNDHVSAPIIIPITAAVVFVCIVLLCIIKCLKSLWDKKKRSDAYEITDLIHEKMDSGRADIPALDQSHDLDTPDHPNLNLVNYSGEKRFHRRSLDFDVESGDGSDSRPASGNGMIRIEAKVHDSSNENNDYDDQEEPEAQAGQQLLHTHNHHHHSHHNDTNHSSVPIVVGLETKALRHNNPPLAPTESEV